MTEPVATIKQGQIKGLTDTDLDGNKYCKFLGIPYAKPPIGPLRFKAPQPAEAWTGIRDGTKEGDGCFAIDFFASKLAGSEDCLYLNVFTRSLPKPGLDSKPVMVHIHGGGFTGGSGTEQVFGAKYLLSEDIVLVTINYRVGIFGFLSSDDLSLDIPGNAGLKDQTFALKWVQENISSFNGDPSNVTIIGESAGGAAVHFQVLSPTAKGLFHKAIAQSGVALNPWAWGQKNVIQVANKMVQKVLSEKDALDILLNATSEEVYKASQKIPDVVLDSANRRPFGPVIEKQNPTAFLTENPTDLLSSGKFNQVPLIMGCTSSEGLMVEFKLPGINTEMTPKDFGVFWSWGLKENSQKHLKVKALVNDFYFKDGKTKEAIHKFIGDVEFNVGLIESTKLAIATSQYPIFLYVFSYKPSYKSALFKRLGNAIDAFTGVTHGGDLMFLFDCQIDRSMPEQDSKSNEEIKVAIKYVTKIFTDFARTGRPHEQWEPATDVDNLQYFDIDQDSKLKVNPFEDRIAFWEKILKEVPDITINFNENATP